MLSVEAHACNPSTFGGLGGWRFKWAKIMPLHHCTPVGETEQNYVYCGTVHNSKDLEPTQMPINDRLNKENVAHIYHGLLCSHKNNEFVSFIGTWVNMETIILSKLTQEQKIKHCMISLKGGCWTIRTCRHREGSITHCGQLGETRGGTAGGGEGGEGWVGRDNVGRNTRYRWWGWRQQTTLPCMYLCNKPACSLHVPQNLKCNKKYIWNK